MLPIILAVFGGYFLGQGLKPEEIAELPIIKPINDNIVEPVVDTVKDIAKPINDDIVAPVVDAVKDTVIDPIDEHIVEPVVDTVKEDVVEPITEGVDDVVYAKGGKVDMRSDEQRWAKPKGWRWKDSAVKKKIITAAELSKSPSKAQRDKYPAYVYEESRPLKSDAKPSHKFKSLGTGGNVDSHRGSKIKMISAYAKEIRKEGEGWIDAIKRSTEELKKQSKI